MQDKSRSYIIYNFLPYVKYCVKSRQNKTIVLE
jgi:hypothetical protein